MAVHQEGNSRGQYNYNAYTYSKVRWKSHFHRNFEFIYLLRGELKICVNESEIDLATGECALILSNQIHSFDVGENTLVWVAVFSEDFVPEFTSFIKNKQGKTPLFKLDESVETVIKECLILNEPSFLLRRACLYAICDQYLQHTAIEERKIKNDLLICRVLDYIQSHYTEHITLERVAEHFGYEYHYLSRLLSKSYHVRFRKLVNDYRMEAAMRALKSGELGITEIAMQCGFQSIRSFNDIFLSETGFSPREYRSRFLEAENVNKM